MSEVVVIGAGLAGLAAGGHEVTVVEARDRVGGRTEGLVLEDGTPLELGGQWVGEGHTRMRSTMKPVKGAVPRLSPFALADLGQGLLGFTGSTGRPPRTPGR